ncbi:hypothetical protein PR048_031750 [Dryococelus australis]|uniref:Uncharacterized protein n=1 Tax=Dryococelus australis TaxID=614101 RepID=A0ABQ9G8T4_9NEOP|nr:hypothetical protein PR048_031750 [Dryococelus australis]
MPLDQESCVPVGDIDQSRLKSEGSIRSTTSRAPVTLSRVRAVFPLYRLSYGTLSGDPIVLHSKSQSVRIKTVKISRLHRQLQLHTLDSNIASLACKECRNVIRQSASGNLLVSQQPQSTGNNAVSCSSQSDARPVPGVPRQPIVEWVLPQGKNRHSSSAGMKGRGKREIPEKTRRPVELYGTIPSWENPGVNRPGIEPETSTQHARNCQNEKELKFENAWIGRGKRDTPEKICRATASSGTNTTSENPVRDPAGDGTRFALVGGEQANRSATNRVAATHHRHDCSRAAPPTRRSIATVIRRPGDSQSLLANGTVHTSDILSPVCLCETYMMDDTDIEQFIEEVNNNPAIWDTSDDGYHDKIKKKTAWVNVIKGSTPSNVSASLDQDVMDKTEASVVREYTMKDQGNASYQTTADLQAKPSVSTSRNSSRRSCKRQLDVDSALIDFKNTPILQPARAEIHEDRAFFDSLLATVKRFTIDQQLEWASRFPIHHYHYSSNSEFTTDPSTNKCFVHRSPRALNCVRNQHRLRSPMCVTSPNERNQQLRNQMCVMSPSRDWQLHHLLKNQLLDKQISRVSSCQTAAAVSLVKTMHPEAAVAPLHHCDSCRSCAFCLMNSLDAAAAPQMCSTKVWLVYISAHVVVVPLRYGVSTKRPPASSSTWSQSSSAHVRYFAAAATSTKMAGALENLHIALPQGQLLQTSLHPLLTSSEESRSSGKSSSLEL